MSYNVSGLTAYIEEQKLELIQAAVEGGKTQSLINVRTGIKETSKFPVLSTAVTLASDGCSRTATDSTVITQVSLSVGDIMVAEDLCSKTLKSYYTSAQMKQGSWDEAENVFEEFYMENKIAQLHKVLEVADWSGNTASGTNNLSYYDGLIKLIDAGSPVDGNPNSELAITKANVIDILWDMYGVIPEAIRSFDKLTVFCGMDTFALYERALYEANMANYISGEVVGSSKFFGASGIQVEGVHGLTGTNRLFLTHADNLFIGVDMENEEEDVRMYQDPSTTSLEYTMRFKRGTAVGVTAEVVEFSV